MSSTQSLYRPGLEGIIAGETAISSIAGGLLYRGYPVEELATRANFEQVAYLLLHGEFPTADELAAFNQRIAAAADLPERVWITLRNLPATTNFMDILRSTCSLTAHFDPEVADNTPGATLRKAERLLAQLACAVGGWERIRRGKNPLPYRADLGFAANVLMMLRGDTPTADEARALDVSLILYAEHEFNASTFTARVVASTLADLHSAITAAIGALKGPLHGGANEQVMAVLTEVASPERAESWIKAALASKRRIMGFGHRVYKAGDPRAKYLKPLCARLATQTGQESLEQMADTIERIVLAEKGLPPNLDWPSARLYHYLRLPIPVYTPLFVASRVTGWSAHVLEQQAHNRLIRPEARYIGPAERQLK
ncbi:MAG: citrate/2-methylcitrate synthase [Pirellulales bacterium]|nr:citrate/2-methylcitrate synthase [Pirellulales bacterium]